MQLGPGERLLWSGKPAPGLRFSTQDIFIIPFALIWLGVAVAGTIAGATNGTNADPAPFFVLPFFVAIGLYIAFGRLVVDAMTRGNTAYALTSRRAVVEGGFFSRAERSVSLAAVAEIGLREGRSGRGTITFGSGGPFAMMPRNWPGARQFMPPAFDGIDNARNVYEMALKAQREGQTGRV